MANAKNETLKKEEQQTQQSQNLETVLLETRKVKALEKIANSLDALTIWFEEIDKKDWGERIAWYLYEFHNLAKGNVSNVDIDANVENSVQSNEQTTPIRKVRPKKDIETV
jgi:hypothetical protein